MIHSTIDNAIEQAERDLWKAGHKADEAFFAWKRTGSRADLIAWEHATERESKAFRHLRDLESLVDAQEGIFA